jgi:alpha-galactosidase
MKSVMRSVKFMMIAAVLGLVSGIASQAASEPLKVFILAGQSNMQGHAHVSTLDSMADDPKTAPILKEMRDADGAPRVCEKVWISQVGCADNGWSDIIEQKGKLAAGFGASTSEIGPEFTFGIYMEKALGEPILLIKTAWGGRNLITDFRPPSAGKRVFNDYILKRWKEMGLNLEQESAKNNEKCSVFYHHMIDHVRKVLADIKRVVPEYDPQQGYELAGFVWFQGFNDLVSDWTYDKGNQPGGYDMYSQLLAQFIRDVRKDLSAPKMPFVIGVMGIGGVKEDKKPGGQMYFRQAQAAPASLPEFQGNVVAVQTAPYWDDDLEALQTRMDANWPKVDARVAAEKNDSWENKMKVMAENFKPEEWKRLRAGASNGGYHYLGAARIMAPIGKAFAEAMANLQKTRRQEKQ